MQIFGIEVRKRARAAMIGAAVYFLLAGIGPFFYGFNEVYFIFLPLLPVVTSTVSLTLAMKDYSRFILTKKWPLIPIALTGGLMIIHMDSDENLLRYLILAAGVYVVIYLLLLQLAFKIRFNRKDFVEAFGLGTLFFLPAASSDIWLVWLASVIIGSVLVQIAIGLITERAFQRRYPGR